MPNVTLSGPYSLQAMRCMMDRPSKHIITTCSPFGLHLQSRTWHDSARNISFKIVSPFQ